MSVAQMDCANATNRVAKLLRACAAGAIFVVSFALLPAEIASAEGASIGVFVDQPTTTVPPTTAPPADEGSPVTTPPDTRAPVVSTTIPTPDATLPDVLPPPVTVKEEKTGIVASTKRAAEATKKVVKDVLSGKPVADAVEAVLPAGAAEVVVPAVRTASTFAFPIGLAGAVIAFLALQQRIDAGDPKLTAAPLAHDDDEVTFQ